MRVERIHQIGAGRSEFGRDGGIRTHDPLTPSQVRYQAALHPESFGEAELPILDHFFLLAPRLLVEAAMDGRAGRLRADGVGAASSNSAGSADGCTPSIAASSRSDRRPQRIRSGPAAVRRPPQ